MGRAQRRFIFTWSDTVCWSSDRLLLKMRVWRSQWKIRRTVHRIQRCQRLRQRQNSKTDISGHENLKSETSSETQESVQMGQVCTTDTSWTHDKWSPDEWNDGWSLDEWNDVWRCGRCNVDCEQTYDTSVSSFSLEISEWVKMNLDTGAAVNSFPSNFGPEGVGDGNFYEWIPDGEAWQCSRIR